MAYSWLGSIKSHLKDGSIISSNSSSDVTYDILNTFDDLIHGGPTENNISISVPVSDGLSVSLGTTVEFDVHIDNGQIVNLNQNATIQSFTVLPGAGVDIQTGNTLTVKSNFTSSGVITIQPGATLSCNANSVNSGSITLAGGSINGSATFTNDGSFQWNSGSLAINFFGDVI